MKIVEYSAKEKVLSAVKKYLDIISPTYGPAGKSVLIGTEFSVRAVDDGKIVSHEFELEDEIEDAVVKYIREATAKTDERVGDGTTTSGIIMAEIVKQILDVGEFDKPKKITEETQNLKKGLNEAIKSIKKAAKKIKTKEELYSVAHNSFNNEHIAKLISDALFKIGTDGALVVEDSKGMTTECEVVNGLEIEKGYVSPYLINTQSGESVAHNPKVVVIKKRIELFTEIAPIIQTLVQNEHREFVIISEGFSEAVIGNMIYHKLQNVFRPILVEAPGFGEEKTQNLIDIATVTGGKVIDPSIDKLAEAKISDFGSCETFTAKKDSSVIVGGKGTKAAINERVSYIKSLLDNATSKFETDKLNNRIAKLLGGLAVIRVGAHTENEQRTIKAKVEDAVNATKVAFREGIVPGAGKTFENIKTSSETLNNALKAPRKHLEDNGKECLDENVFDPAEVLIASLESAVSIAVGLINMGGIIATERKEKDKEPKF